MNLPQRIVKRSFDLFLALFGLLLFGWAIILCWLIASIDTGRSGFFMQTRVGRGGRPFRLIKIRTMRPIKGVTSNVTSRTDPRITAMGARIRRWKLDELPQLVNVLTGDMSFVGPRPDVPGFADQLTGDDRIILSVRPGITGPATLAFVDEEDLLAESDDPGNYNRNVIYPAKVRMNKRYVRNHGFFGDLRYILATVIPALRNRVAPPFNPELDNQDRSKGSVSAICADA